MPEPVRAAFGRRPSPPGSAEPAAGAQSPTELIAPLALAPPADRQPVHQFEQRAVARARTLQSGRVLVNDEGDGFDCTVRDLSIAGAGIRVPSGGELPNTLRLLMIREGLLFDCVVVWRQDERAGLRFIGRHDLREAGRDFDSVRQLWKMLSGR